MPIGPGGIAAIYGSAQAVTAGVNAYSQGRMNKKTRKWNEGMYNRQLADNERFWNMQNEYNSPEQQMQRLKAAGLNPNLVYGDGATAMSKSAPSGADVKAWSPDAPKIEGNPIGDTMLKYYDLQQQKQVIDNLKQQFITEGKRQELTSAQTIAELKKAGYTDVQIAALTQDIEQKSKMNPISLQAATQNIEKTSHEIGKIKADTAFTTDSNRRAKITLEDHLKNTKLGREKTESEIAEIAQKILNLIAENKVTEYKNLLHSLGIQENDPWFIKLLKALPGYNGKSGFETVQPKSGKSGGW